MAIQKITMPQLGESVTEGTIEKWLVQPGDAVEKYDALAEVTTDKVTAEIPSSFAGKITEIIANEGETIEVGGTVCLIEAEGTAAQQQPVVESAETTVRPEQERSAQQAQPAKPSAKLAARGKAAGRYSPAVLRLSQEHEIDLSQVSGSGREGRITRKDLLAFIEDGGSQTAQAVTEQPSAASEKQPVQQELTYTDNEKSGFEQNVTPNVQLENGDIEIPVTSIRRAIAKNMVRSVTEAPHAWTMIEVDVTELVALRDGVKDEFKEKEGFNLTYFAFFIKAVSQALKEFPAVNSMWAGDKIVMKKDVNISIAVATDEALYVPVIKQTDEKTIKALARDIHELAGKVRNGKLQTKDMQGGTFTVNNTGSFGSVQSMGIINYPQAAILQVETIVKRPVVMNNGMVAIRDIVNLCLSLDHRVLDGLVCGRFLARVKELLENMSKDQTSLY
ncbi:MULTISPECIES: dihydrolipoamide acetyltransferase family protein [unclassified Sporosarcina]|uniref:dihydrolipoamide acetyltransferase family protein n=1 Tax=unclassified Sporosarcina TaxID=2647733 RepID=UPI00203BEA61|nr:MULTISPECIES: dihydrolipoamide acetyltransferase family protein [unclassified Sporosarcina]GKV64550.1 lipoamide acyltransferase component of branched-chain alpha-keto acid dehydrogenase complex [Sporosarcina sp. NCCP-2331]GLB54577.1 lipoamide acyltransferase component of branched-chain alpha-keto acid dehydrogenase complex [Sporosarcina sp. NCCP-2378]